MGYVCGLIDFFFLSGGFVGLVYLWFLLCVCLFFDEGKLAFKSDNGM